MPSTGCQYDQLVNGRIWIPDIRSVRSYTIYFPVSAFRLDDAAAYQGMVVPS
jgi:hypothetical protein